MAVDYDLVLVGSNLASWQLALSAVRYGARTGWVTLPELLSPFYLQQLLQPQPNWVEYLQVQGVDVIEAMGEFVSNAIFQVKHRRLSARYFVLCEPLRPFRQPNELLAEFYNNPLAYREVNIAGGNYFSCAIAQFLAKNHISVNLLVPQSRILSQYDPEVVRLLQAHLEGAGIAIYTDYALTGTESAIFPVFPSISAQVHAGLVETRRIRYLRSWAEIKSILQTVIGSVKMEFSPAEIVNTDPPLIQLGQPSRDGKEILNLRSFRSDYYLKISCQRNGKILGAVGLGQRAVDMLSSLRTQKIQGIPIGTHTLWQELLNQFVPPTRPTLWLNIKRDFDLC
ncbi:MAG: NAD-binding protein [Pseudanabaenaceae cyanobacterium]